MWTYLIVGTSCVLSLGNGFELFCLPSFSQVWANPDLLLPEVNQMRQVLVLLCCMWTKAALGPAALILGSVENCLCNSSCNSCPAPWPVTGHAFSWTAYPILSFHLQFSSHKEIWSLFRVLDCILCCQVAGKKKGKEKKRKSLVLIMGPTFMICLKKKKTTNRRQKKSQRQKHNTSVQALAAVLNKCHLTPECVICPSLPPSPPHISHTIYVTFGNALVMFVGCHASLQSFPMMLSA